MGHCKDGNRNTLHRQRRVWWNSRRWQRKTSSNVREGLPYVNSRSLCHHTDTIQTPSTCHAIRSPQQWCDQTNNGTSWTHLLHQTSSDWPFPWLTIINWTQCLHRTTSDRSQLWWHQSLIELACSTRLHQTRHSHGATKRRCCGESDVVRWIRWVQLIIVGHEYGWTMVELHSSPSRSIRLAATAVLPPDNQQMD